MTSQRDPTEPMRTMAASMAGSAQGTACNQSSFKAGKSSFFFVGPGAKGVGFKAMFKLDRSIPQAEELASEAPDRFEVGSTRWVTTRFTAEDPLPKSLWKKWLVESYGLATGSSSQAKPSRATKVAKKTKKRSTKKSTRTPPSSIARKSAKKSSKKMAK